VFRARLLEKCVVVGGRFMASRRHKVCSRDEAEIKNE